MPDIKEEDVRTGVERDGLAKWVLALVSIYNCSLGLQHLASVEFTLTLATDRREKKTEDTQPDLIKALQPASRLPGTNGIK